jgi:transcriptional regulator of met regulon
MKKIYKDINNDKKIKTFKNTNQTSPSDLYCRGFLYAFIPVSLAAKMGCMVFFLH